MSEHCPEKQRVSAAQGLVEGRPSSKHQGDRLTEHHPKSRQETQHTLAGVGKRLCFHMTLLHKNPSPQPQKTSWVWYQSLEPQFPGIFHHMKKRYIANVDSPRDILVEVQNVSSYSSTLGGQISRLIGKEHDR